MITFDLNGQTVSAEPRRGQTLLRYLRDEMGLHDVKEGCGTGHCGACTVIVDGEAVRACTIPLHTVNLKSVTTIKGLSENGKMHPIQRAFLDAGAVQCGFCTPGMVLAVKALLDKNPRPARGEIETALSHNICRCTGYVKILLAVRLAAERMYPDAGGWPDETVIERTSIIQQTGMEALSGLTYFGRSEWDYDGIKKVTGSLAYADDRVMPGMLYGAMVWSKHPSAEVLSVDISGAEACPGTVRVFTAGDVPGRNGFGLTVPDQPVFCDHEVRFLMDAVALAIADTPEHARKAAAAVRVEYQPRAGIFDMDTPHEHGEWSGRITHEKGSVESAKSDPELRVYKGRFETPYQEHAYLEPECVIAYRDKDGAITVETPTQGPFELRRQLAAVLGMPEERIRVRVTPLGGGFGGKGDPCIEPMAAVAAYHLDRPVKITLTRKESLGVSTKRHPYHIWYELGMKPDGAINYIDAVLLADGGPYDNRTMRVLDQSCIFSMGPYRVPNARVRGYAVRTNNVPTSAFRGFGINQVCFALESLLDEASRDLGTDPFELRLKNALREGDVSFSGQWLNSSVGLVDTLLACRREAESALAELSAQYPKGDKVLGLGVASAYKNVGAGKGKRDDASATFTCAADGKVRLCVSGVDMGQGFRTGMLQIAAEALGISPGEIELVTDVTTDDTPPYGAAIGERQTLASGNAILGAAAKFKEFLASDEYRPGEGFSVSYEYLAPRTFKLDDEDRDSVPPEEYRNYPAYAYTTQAVIVESDKATGASRVLKVIAAHDVGRLINPHIAEGQVEGSCSMGIGYALSETFSVRDGKPQNLLFGELGLPTAADTPDYNIIFVEDPEKLGPFGAKGMSEVATVPVIPAIANAIYDALGVRVHKLPAVITRQKISPTAKWQK